MRRKRTEYEYVVQSREARGTPDMRAWQHAGIEPFRRHKDALDVAKALTKEPANRGHDRYYRVLRREVRGATA